MNPSVFALWSPWAWILWEGRRTRAVPAGTDCAGSLWEGFLEKGLNFQATYREWIAFKFSLGIQGK